MGKLEAKETHEIPWEQLIPSEDTCFIDLVTFQKSPPLKGSTESHITTLKIKLPSHTPCGNKSHLNHSNTLLPKPSRLWYDWTTTTVTPNHNYTRSDVGLLSWTWRWMLRHVNELFLVISTPLLPRDTALDQWSCSHLHGRVCAALNPNSSSKEGPWKGLMSQSQMWHKQDFCSPLPTHSSKKDQEMSVAMCPTPYLVPQEETKTHLLLYPPPYRDVTLGKLA